MKLYDIWKILKLIQIHKELTNKPCVRTLKNGKSEFIDKKTKQKKAPTIDRQIERNQQNGLDYTHKKSEPIKGKKKKIT